MIRIDHIFEAYVSSGYSVTWWKSRKLDQVHKTRILIKDKDKEWLGVECGKIFNENENCSPSQGESICGLMTFFG